MKVLQPNLITPSQFKARRSILPVIALRHRSFGLNRLKTLWDPSLTIETDGWSSSNGISILATVTSPDGQSMLLDLVNTFDEPHTAD
jgi:hypothetical protein